MILESINHVNFYEQAKLKYLFGKSDPLKDYTIISYLQCTGSQYIDTGCKFDKQYSYTIDCEIDNESGNQMFGMKWWYDHAVFIRDNKYYICNTRDYVYYTSISAGNRVVINISLLNKAINIDYSDLHYSQLFNSFDPSSSIYPVVLGACWSSWDNTLSEYGKGKIYSFKYYENGVLLRDMIPVIRKSDNKPGMWDKINNQFYTNQGTGEFKTPIYGYLSGNPPFTFNSNGNPLVDYTISGNAIQSGTPTPENPIMPQGCGDLETSGAKAGQYKIPISCGGTTDNVYLGEVETTRKIKKLVLDGTENWKIWAMSASSITERFYINIVGVGADTSICSHFQFAENNSDIIHFRFGGTNINELLFWIDKQVASTIADFKAYLQQQYSAGTPVTVWYVLAEPETGIVNEPLMKIGDYADTLSKAQTGVEIPTINGSNTLTVDTSLQPSEVSIVYEK